MRAGLSFTYFSWCLVKLWNYHRNISKHPEVPHRQRLITLRWITLLIGTLAITSLSYVLMVFDMKDKSLSPELFSKSGFFIALLLFYIIVSLSLLFFPEILYGLPRADFKWPRTETIQVDRTIISDPTLEDAENPNIKGHTLQAGEKDETDPFNALSDGILHYLIHEKPYLDQKFSVTDIGLHFGVPRHHVDYCFAKIIGEKFTDIRKRLRVEHAKLLLPEHRNLSLEGVGKDAGFASKSSFFSSFREVTGMTPAEYIKSLEDRG